MSRYVVVSGSQSLHCCFQATVVDSTKPTWWEDEFESVCECLSMEAANKVAKAMNFAEEFPEDEYAIGGMDLVYVGPPK